MKEPVKREPVPLEPETPIVIDVPHENDDWIHLPEVKNRHVNRPLTPVDEDGWRQCARVDCGSTFQPDTPSRTFCSDECAQINFYRENGMGHKAEALMANERRDENGALVKARGAANPEKDAKKDARYGPLREIERVISESKGRKRVVFKVCAHEASVKADVKRSRCRTCRNAAAKGANAPAPKTKREPVAREAVKREPVGLEVVESAPLERVGGLNALKEFVKRGQDAQKAVNEAIKKEGKKLVPRAEKAFKKAARKLRKLPKPRLVAKKSAKKKPGKKGRR